MGVKDINMGRYHSLLIAVWVVLVLTVAAGCSAFLPPTDSGTDPTPLPATRTPEPSLTLLPTTPPVTLTPTVTPTQPGNGLVPSGPINSPPDGFQPTPPSPPDVGSAGHKDWVRDYVALVTDLLNSGRTPQDVLHTLIDWSTPRAGEEERSAGWFEATDLDGDRTAEYVFSLPVPERGCSDLGCPGYVVLFVYEEDLFKPAYVIRGNPPHAIQMQQPRLLQVEDLNADGLLEVLLRQRYCGAHTCTTELTIGRWDGSVWRDLAADPINQSYTDLSIEDRDGDGVLEFVMHGGTYGSVGAGLQRPHTLVFDWVNGSYRQVEDIPDPSDHPYYLMLDANTALENENWVRALNLAEQALAEPDFSDTMYPVEDVDRRRIVSYAAVEAMLVYAHREDVGAMQNVLDQARGYAFYQPNPYSEAAERLLSVYRDTRDIAAACVAMEEVITDQPEEAVFFQEYGYNTERLTADQICPLNQPAEGESPQL